MTLMMPKSGSLSLNSLPIRKLLNFVIILLFFNKFYYICGVTSRIMEQKPITKKQMRWRVSLGAVTILLGCLSIMLNRTWIERILAALLLAIPIGSLIHTIWQWKKHPLVDEEVDRELKEEQKSVLIASGSMLLLYSFIILFIILTVRAF